MIKLQVLFLRNNNLTEHIPSSFGNLSSLQELDLTSNHLSGRVPHTLGQLKSFSWFGSGDNDFEGTIPPSIFNLSSMESFGVGDNRLHGSLPSELGIFSPSLQYFGIYDNQFTGSIPSSITNASNLNAFFLDHNNLTGEVPNLEKLHQLRRLNIAVNRFGSAAEGDLDFLSTLTNNTNLEVVVVNENNLGGTLPQSIANLSSSTLRFFSFDDNQIKGVLPNGIGNLRSLEFLTFLDNILSGEIPKDIGKLQRLKILYLDLNYFTGNIPSSIGNLSNLIDLDLSVNKLQGKIPTNSIGRCQNLLSLQIYDNKLNGSIPVEVFSISSLSIKLDLSWNQFVGPLPTHVGRLKNLGFLDVSHNMLSGQIPSTLGNCESLEWLAMEGNVFEGKIPPSLTSLRGLAYLNLSHNKLSGEIPNFLQTFPLQTLDLSFNKFSGVLPTGGIFSNASATSFEGNNMLCAATREFHLLVCTNMNRKKRRLILNTKITIAMVLSSLAIFVALSLLTLWFSKKRSERMAVTSSEDSVLQVSYQSLFEATGGFSSTNLIGIGSFGSVYKGILNLQETVAVKVFNLKRRGASRSFIVECEALRNIRHRNLVKVITVCSSIDFHGDEFKAIIYEFMVNGNLDPWLHPPTSNDTDETPKRLNLIQRLNIAVDVACALKYLHHEHCQTPIVHCDLKPSNILLDDEIVGKVSDFGLVKFLPEEGKYASASSFGVRGTIGYAAPEYGMGSEVSTYGDVYSYGILLLEMFTRKKPTDDMFDNDINLRNYVKMALPEQVAEITEPTLLEGTQDYTASNEKVTKSLIAIFEIGIACSQEMPRDRMNISTALAKLIVIRTNLQ